MGNQASAQPGNTLLPKIEVDSPNTSSTSKAPLTNSIESPSAAEIRQKIREEVSNSPKVSPKGPGITFFKRNSKHVTDIPKLRNVPALPTNSEEEKVIENATEEDVSKGENVDTQSDLASKELEKKAQTPKKPIGIGGVTDPLEVSPQRRLHFIDVAVGASGALTKRVFEVREREVTACPKSQMIPLEAPQVVHSTTSMLIVRWEADSWSDAKQIASYELQWCQPDLEEGSQLAANAQVTEEGGGATQLEVFCDNKFCTVPRKVVQSIDTRNEVVLYGLPGGSKPIYFRVRAKALPSKFEKDKTGGWCTWSPVSKIAQTLPDLHANINPDVLLVSSHLLQLSWSAPPESHYGKVVIFQLFGRCPKLVKALSCEATTEEPPGEKKASASEEEKAEDPRDPDKFGWILLKEQQTSTFTVGVHETAIEARAVENPECDEMMAPYRLVGSQFNCLPYHLLPAAEEFEFYVVARTGSWFHGMFYYNELKSDIRRFRTLPAVPDPPPAPFLLPYHGIVTRTSVELRWKAPTTYGNGHTQKNYAAVYGNDGDNWFGLTISPKVQGDGGPAAVSNWRDLNEKTKHQDEMHREMLRGLGWELRQGDATHGTAYWSNILTGESSWGVPKTEGLMNMMYMLLAKPVESTGVWNSFVAIYQGDGYMFEAGGVDSPLPLRQDTEYEFKILCENRHGKASMPSVPLRVRTIADSSKQTSDTEPDLPKGWVECWDCDSGYCYYFNEKSGQTQWTHPSGPLKDDPNLPFRKKKFKLMYNIQRDLPPPEGYGALRLVINRKNILKDSMDQLGCVPVDRLKLRTNITFEGEDGIDSGGISNEWYMQLSKSFFDSKWGLMKAHEENLSFSIRKTAIDETALRRLRFLGRIMGKAIYDKRLLDLPFSTFIFKQLLNRPLTMDDLFEVDPLYHTSLQWMLANEIENLLFETFSVLTADENGNEKEIDLIPNGKNIDVTDTNKHEFVDKMVEWHLSKSIEKQMESLLEGFEEIVPTKYLQEFDVQELKLLFNGSPIIKVRDLRKNVTYKGGYSSKSKPVQYFWEVFAKMSQPERSEVLSFITGCPKLPLDGVSLQFVKSELGPDALPTSHTCFNQLVLPEHESREQVLEKLKKALENAQGFTMS